MICFEFVEGLIYNKRRPNVGTMPIKGQKYISVTKSIFCHKPYTPYSPYSPYLAPLSSYTHIRSQNIPAGKLEVKWALKEVRMNIYGV